jgi:hypothetical protein
MREASAVEPIPGRALEVCVKGPPMLTHQRVNDIDADVLFEPLERADR